LIENKQLVRTLLPLYLCVKKGEKINGITEENGPMIFTERDKNKIVRKE